MNWYKLIFMFVFVLSLGWIVIPIGSDALEKKEVFEEITELIWNYYDLLNQQKVIQAQDIVDQRLKNVHPNGVVQQYLLKDAVISDASRFEHMLKYESDYTLYHQPKQIHIQTTDDIVVATYYLTVKKHKKEDESLLSESHTRVTWVLSKKNGDWVLLHEHQSDYLPEGG